MSTNGNNSSSSDPKALALVAGVWSRDWEEDPLGDVQGADRDTLVLWTQSSQCGIYVDLRLPLKSPGRSEEAARALGVKPYPSALAAAPARQAGSLLWQRLLASSGDEKAKSDVLQTILAQKSFAGELNAQPGDTTSSGKALKKDTILAAAAAAASPTIPLCTCFWRRDLDYQPPSGGLDIGVCCTQEDASAANNDKDAPLLLRETGDDGSYAEGWLRVPGSEQGPFLALKLLSEKSNTSNQEHKRAGYWVRAGSRFAYAVGRPTTAEMARELACTESAAKVNDCVGKSLDQAVKHLGDNSSNESDMLDIASSYVAVAGEIVGDDNQWKILHSTNPELVGCHLLIVGNSSQDELCCSRLSLAADSSTSTPAIVQQVIPLSSESGGGDVTRRWEVVEQIGCDLPLTAAK